MTKLQRAVLDPLIKAEISDKLLLRFTNLPKIVRNSFDQSYFEIEDKSKLDKAFLQQFNDAAKVINNQINELRITSDNEMQKFKMKGAFKNFSVNYKYLKTLKEYLADKIDTGDYIQPAPEPDRYHFRLKYRGITVHKAKDRGVDHVEPYMIASFMYNSAEDPELKTIVSPFVIKHIPSGLGEMNPGYWSARGGAYSNGEPKKPVTIQPRVGRDHTYSTTDNLTLIPAILSSDKLFYAILSVWEEDGDQSAKICQAIGEALITIGGAVIAATGGSVVGAVVGAVIVVIGAILELIGFLLGSDDDPIEDTLIAFDKTELDKEYWREIDVRVSDDDRNNDWTLYFSAESKKEV